MKRNKLNSHSSVVDRLVRLSALFLWFYLDYRAYWAEEEHPKDEIESILSESKQIENTEVGSSQNKGFFKTLIDRTSIPDISVSLDFTGAFDIHGNEEDETLNGYFVREGEFAFSGAIDQLTSGHLGLAFHRGDSGFFVELHEAYLEFPSLPFDIFIKAGRFFYDIGRLNNFHRHDWDFTIAPLVHERLFDQEGVFDTGGEISYLMPWTFYQEIKFGVFNGRTFGHVHNQGFRKPHPLYTVRAKHFIALPYDIGMQWNFTFFRYNVTRSERDANYTYGTDLTFKWKRGKLYGFTWSTELWYQDKRRESQDVNEKALGLYSYIQYQFLQNWQVGFRFDYFSEPDSFSLRQDGLFNPEDYAQSLWLTYRPSEFSYFRATLERNDPFEKEDNYIFRIQAVFILGYHPAHTF